jgi:hypothetical protein
MIRKKNQPGTILDDKIIKTLIELSGDPYAFVMWAFPWGTGSLARHEGPEDWQKEILCLIRDGMSLDEALQIAVASGHDIGKSALVAWIVLWGISTCIDARGVVTANTESQLKQKTWAELSKWYNLFIAKKYFELTATAIFARIADHEKSWRFDIVPWSERNTEAFAGMHNEGKRAFMIFDEASAIPDGIWEVAEGPMMGANTERLWLAFGNPTRNTGRFYDCFHRFRHRWINRQIDSRNVRLTDKTQIGKLVKDWGEDSDYIRVRVRGVFPRSSDRQYISSEYIERGRGKHLRVEEYNFAAKIIGVDAAYYGPDKAVIYLRQGLMSKKLGSYPKIEPEILAGYVAGFEDEYQADAVFIDQGEGSGVMSAGSIMGRKWMLIPFGGVSADPQYLNKRAEMYGLAKDWLRAGGALPDNAELCEQLGTPEYRILPDGKIKVELKEEIVKRLGCSPDDADSFVLTFAHPVRPKPKNVLRDGKEFYNKGKPYDPLNYKNR